VRRCEWHASFRRTRHVNQGEKPLPLRPGTAADDDVDGTTVFTLDHDAIEVPNRPLLKVEDVNRPPRPPVPAAAFTNTNR
jgi:hypothetical protein